MLLDYGLYNFLNTLFVSMKLIGRMVMHLCMHVYLSDWIHVYKF